MFEKDYFGGDFEENSVHRKVPLFDWEVQKEKLINERSFKNSPERIVKSAMGTVFTSKLKPSKGVNKLMNRMKERMTEAVINTRELEENKLPFDVDENEMPTKKTRIINYNLYKPYLLDKKVREK